MAGYSGMILTTAGLNLQAQAQLGGQLIITRIAIGDGLLGEGESYDSLTALKNQVMTLGIQDLEVTGTGQSRIRALLSNSSLAAGFFVREIGVFAKIGAEGTETLYSYTNAGSTADYLPIPSLNAVEEVIEVYIVVGNAQNVTANIIESVTLATKADVTEGIAAHNALANAHSLMMQFWQPGYNYAVGDCIRPKIHGSYKYLECTVGGQSGTVEPTWGDVGSTVTDGGVTWVVKRVLNNVPYNRQIYTTAGTYTFVAPVSGLYKVTVVGAGGGSGGAKTTTSYSAATGGGAGGGCAIKNIFLVAGTSVTVTVGAGGIAGTATPTSGGVGGTSSFGAYCSATGGAASGLVNNTNSYVMYGNGGNASGIGSGGDINMQGGAGSPAVPVSGYSSNGQAYPGSGGASFLSGSPSHDEGAGVNGVLGAGGCGTDANGNNARAGGAGGDGVVIIEW